MADRFLDWILHFAPPPSTQDYDGTDEGEVKISGGAWLDALVTRLAISAQEREKFIQICEAQEAEIALCVERPSITLWWRDEGGRREEFHFGSLQPPLSDIFPSDGINAPRRRLTVFPMAIFAAAGELAADTLGSQSSDLPFPPSGSTPESGNAPDLPGSGAPTRTKQPRDRHAAGTTNTPETKRVCSNYQGHNGERGPFHVLKEPRSYEA